MQRARAAIFAAAGERGSPKGPATCTFEIEPQGEATKLILTHTIAKDKSKLIEAVSDGWSKILSNLKSLIETGDIVLRRK